MRVAARPSTRSREKSRLTRGPVDVREEITVLAQDVFHNKVAGQELEQRADVQAAAVEALDQFGCLLDQCGVQELSDSIATSNLLVSSNSPRCCASSVWLPLRK